MDDVNPFAAPRSGETGAGELARRTAGVVYDGDGVWRDGELLVVRKPAVLPDRCVKCNRPAEGGRLRCWLLNLHPSFILFLAPGLPIYIVLYVIWALFKRRMASVEIGLCESHRRKRQEAIVIGCSLILFGTGLFFLTAFLGHGSGSILVPVSVFAAMILFCVGAFYAVSAVRQVASERIEDGYVWLKNVDPAYLDELPDFFGEFGTGFGLRRE